MSPSEIIAAKRPKKKPREKGSYVEFPAPEDFVPPDSVKEGAEFTALGTFQIKEDGIMCLLAVDGSPVSPASQQSEPPAPPPPAAPVMPGALPQGVL